MADAIATTDPLTLLSARFAEVYPREAARHLEKASEGAASAVIAALPVALAARVWSDLAPGFAATIFPSLAQDTQRALLGELPRSKAIGAISLLGEAEREALFDGLDASLAAELREAFNYPPDSAGRLMDIAILPQRASATVGEVLPRLRRANLDRTGILFLVDDGGRLVGSVSFKRFVTAGDDDTLRSISSPPIAVVQPMDPKEDVVRKLQDFHLREMPVVDHEGVLIGVIRHDQLLDTLQQSVTADIQSMVGVSKEERALSSSWFAIRKRLPWLQVNLLTAFLAAAVVGVFEDTIARFTALAVLLPVVAGQSGNTGAQALAVTMRGLALREIRVPQWPRVTMKELTAGFFNGIGIAITCSIGVLIWSGSLGLVLVIALSMVISMVMAGLAGALTPIVLARLGQDPAVASSIILTTITDIVGFFSFLGIATILSGMLPA